MRGLKGGEEGDKEDDPGLVVRHSLGVIILDDPCQGHDLLSGETLRVGYLKETLRQQLSLIFQVFLEELGGNQGQLGPKSQEGEEREVSKG